MSQSTAKEQGLKTGDRRDVRVEGEDGKEALVTTSPELKYLESIDATLKKILLILEANT